MPKSDHTVASGNRSGRTMDSVPTTMTPVSSTMHSVRIACREPGWPQRSSSTNPTT